MRKLSQDQIEHQKRHAAKLHARKLAWKRWRKWKNQVTVSKSVTIFRDGKSVKAQAKRAIPLPESLCLDANTEETLRFLNEAWDNVLKTATEPRRSIKKNSPYPVIKQYYDFTTLKHLSPSAALVLASLFQRSKYITGFKLGTVDEHLWDPIVTLVLRCLGFHELLDMRPFRNEEFETADLKILKFKSGRQAEGEPPGRLQEALADLLPESLKENLLTAEPYGGMFEAILNAHSWAYPEDHPWEYPVLPNWWITGAVDTKSNKIIVSVFDQGVSIPVSLPRWTHWSKFELRGRKLVEKLKLTTPIDHPANDGLAIQLAMKIARSNTLLPQHGKGLHTMVEVAQRAKHGRLRILSRNGEFVWETGKKPRSLTHNNPLRGTLVEWQLQL